MNSLKGAILIFRKEVTIYKLPLLMSTGWTFSGHDGGEG